MDFPDPTPPTPRPAPIRWVWRGFAVLGLVAGVTAALLAWHGSTGSAVAWLVVAGVWFALAGGLRRMHATMDTDLDRGPFF